MKVEIQIPFFSGFYGSIWSDEMDDALLNGPREEDLKYWEGWAVDYKEYEQEVAEEYARLYVEKLNDVLELDISQEEQAEVVSPKEYNFSTDRIFVDIEFHDLDKVKALMLENKDEMSRLIKKNHTSYDGFWSFMSNQFDEWIDKHLDYEDGDFGLYLSYALAYLVGIKDTFDIDTEFYYELSGNVLPHVYPETDEAKEEYEKFLIVERAGMQWDADKYEPIDVDEVKRRAEEYTFDKKYQLQIEFNY